MTSENNCNLSDAERIIGYSFKDKSLLVAAFTHSSYANEHKNVSDYQRLEFLGDAVLGYIVGARLFSYYPSANEGELSKRRAFMVSAEILSKVIDKYDLIKYLRVGSGQVSDEVKCSENVKCDLFEAIVGAIVLDCKGDFTYAKEFIWKGLELFLDFNNIDYKSKTLEYCAKQHLPCKIETEKSLSENKKIIFISKLFVSEKVATEGTGKSKHTAEREACRIFYDKFIR